jgi:hypothetical protein
LCVFTYNMTLTNSTNPSGSGLEAEYQGTTAPTIRGTSLVTQGTITASPRAVGSAKSLFLKQAYTTAAVTPGSITGQRQGQLLCYGAGGYTFELVFSLQTLAAGNRGFFGLSSSLVNATNVDPLTSVLTGVGLAFNANTGNFSIVYGNGAAPTVVATTKPVNTTDAYLLQLSTTVGNDIAWKIITSGGNPEGGIITTNLPTTGTFLAPYMWMTNNTTGALVSFNLSKWTLTSRNY